MSLLDKIKQLPADIAEAISKASNPAEGQPTKTKFTFAGIKLVIKTGADDVDYDALSLDELEDLLDKLETQLFALQDEEPEDETSDEYEEWEDAVEELEDLIEEVQDAIDDREEE